MAIKKAAKKKPKTIKQILEDNKSVRLDVACGSNKQKGFIGMDMFAYPGVDIVHNALTFPWPIPDNSVDLMTASHFLEHIPAFGTDTRLSGLVDLLISKQVITNKEAMTSFGEHRVFSYFIRFMDEAWRVLKVGGQFAFLVPYWESLGFAQDPTHVKMMCEASMVYFDPEVHDGTYWNFYKPKPWKIEMQSFNGNGNMETVISKRDIKPYEKRIEAHTV